MPRQKQPLRAIPKTAFNQPEPEDQLAWIPLDGGPAFDEIRQHAQHILAVDGEVTLPVRAQLMDLAAAVQRTLDLQAMLAHAGSQNDVNLWQKTMDMLTRQATLKRGILKDLGLHRATTALAGDRKANQKSGSTWEGIL